MATTEALQPNEDIFPENGVSPGQSLGSSQIFSLSSVQTDDYGEFVLSDPQTMAAIEEQTNFDDAGLNDNSSSSGIGNANPILAAIGAVVNVFAADDAADNRRAQYEAAARNLYTRAAETRRQGQYMAMTRGMALEERLGNIRAAVGAGGVRMSGSVATAYRQTEALGRVDIEMTKLNAARAARGIEAQAAQYAQSAEDSEFGTLDVLSAIF